MNNSTFVKIKRPFNVVDAKVIEFNGKAYIECLVRNYKCSIIAVATNQVSEPLIREYKLGRECKDLTGEKLVAWLTVNERGHTISYIRKEN